MMPPARVLVPARRYTVTPTAGEREALETGLDVMGILDEQTRSRGAAGPPACP
jgi:hypothetical protein